jgi:two-component system KDP operon response regulator KdpE
MSSGGTERKNLILVVDDEPQIRKLLRIYLEESGYKVEESDSGKQAVRLATSLKPDLMVLDLGLPDMDGKEVAAMTRTWSQLPIIILSVRSEDDEVVKALDLGADDYLTKPFSGEVLLARIRACLRKSATREAGEPELQNGAIRMDLVRHEVFVNNAKVSLTPKEYELLRYLMVNRGKMLTHRQILKEVWGAAQVDNSHYLRVYVCQLREKLDKYIDSQSYITTELGIGYRMETISSPETDAVSSGTTEEPMALAAAS